MKSRTKLKLAARSETAIEVRTPAAEQFLIEEIPAIGETRILCTSLGRGQFAQIASNYSPRAYVVCQFFDSYLAQQAAERLNEAGGHRPTGWSRVPSAAVVAGTLRVPSAAPNGAGEGLPFIHCSADFPAELFDMVALPIDPRGEAELTRDLLQSGHERLAVGGRLLAATSSPDDQWLHTEMRKLFDKVTRRPSDDGVLYLAKKTASLKKRKNFDCEFAFRDRGQLIKAFSRPGVFSHRSLDAGARALINTMLVRDGDHVLDLGCGSGVVSLAAAFRANRVAVVALDSHARAVECTAIGAKLNALESVTANLNHGGHVPEPGSFDLVLGNPPYYSDYRIAEIFLQAARRALKPGGKVLIVAKSYAWYATRMPELFDNVQLHPHKQYTVIEGTQMKPVP